MGDNYLGNNAFPAAQNIAGMALGIPLAAIQIANSGNPLQYLQQRSQLLQDPNFRALAGPFTAGLLEVAGGQQQPQLAPGEMGPPGPPSYQPNLPPLNPQIAVAQQLAGAEQQALQNPAFAQQAAAAQFGVPIQPDPNAMAAAGFRPYSIGPRGMTFRAGPPPVPSLTPTGVPDLFYDPASGRYVRAPQDVYSAAHARAQAAADVQQQNLSPFLLPPPAAPPAAPAAAPAQAAAPAPAAAPSVALPQGYVPPASLTPDQLNAPLNPSPAFDDRVGFPPPAFDDQNVQVQTPRGAMGVPAWAQQMAQGQPVGGGIPALPSATRPAPTPLADLSSRLPPRSSLSIGPRGQTLTMRGPTGDKSDFTKAAGQKALQVLMRAKESIVRLRQAGVLTDNALTGTLGYNRAALEYTARFSDDRQARDDATFLLRNLQSTVPTLARGFGEQRVNQQEEQRIREALSFNRVPSTFAESVIDNYISLFGGQPQSPAGGARILQFTPRQ